MDGVGMGGMVMWIVLWALAGPALLALAVAGVVWLMRHSAPQTGRQRESAEEIVKRRYTAGEIDEEEFERRRAGLQ